MKRFFVVSLMVYVAYMAVLCQAQRDKRLSVEANLLIDANGASLSVFFIPAHRLQMKKDDKIRIITYNKTYPAIFTKVNITEISVTVAANRPKIPITIVIPNNYTTGRPVMFYYPGGGFMYASTRETYRPAVTHLALLTGCIIVGIDSRLAPENKFPIGLDDAKLTTQYLLKNKGLISPRAVNASFGVVGDSTGSNFANVIANELTKTSIKFQVLYYGMFNLNQITPSRKEFTSVRYLMPATFFFTIDGVYFANKSDSNSSRFNSVKGVTANSPPALMILSQLDPVRNDSDWLLKDSMDSFNVPYEIRIMTGMVHGFFTHGHICRRTFYEAAMYAKAFIDKF